MTETTNPRMRSIDEMLADANAMTERLDALAQSIASADADEPDAERGAHPTMTTETTTAPSPTEADRAAAWEKRRELEAERDALPPTHPGRDDFTRKILATTAITHAPRPAPAKTPPFTLEQQLAADDQITSLRERLTKIPEGDPRRDRINARILELTRITHADEIAPREGQDSPTFTDHDADKIAKEYGMTAEARARFAKLSDALGATPIEQVQLLTTIRGFDGRTPPDPNSLDLARLWGADAAANVVAAKRAKAAIPPHDFDEHIAPFLGVAAVVNLLVQVGRRKGGA